ncbi:hypothetical protein EIN_275260 [Entamoeba invadens IP1]|uniref:MD-2-related lipid-recognition domain-containing protein n=1 Tax=Entamoeba invadens IP1 TaxID=370355 RepID=A0A0A1U1M6_ENTIV|nr:hypothetical protein EIN_275260 [Entamoeba invadens IP1]ELP87939.1 hypothetical protein EIN_275260 [Entamoeba invadens IP1]|eukprot:XP_004254710.1 hypothetical protein EIN_275260 [Entamoeba invadens IP1]
MLSSQLLILLIISQIALCDSVPFISCCNDSKVKVLKIEGTPWPPVSGVDLTLSIEAEVLEDLKSLYLNATASQRLSRKFWIPINSVVRDICRSSPILCPIKQKKTIKIKETYEIPPSTPINSEWKLKMSFTAVDGGDEIGCILLDSTVIRM